MSVNPKELSQSQGTISPEELKRDLTMIVQDEDAPWALGFIKQYGLIGEENEVTPDQALVICRSRLKAIKEAERAHCKPLF